MARTASNPFPIGKKAPNFNLIDTLSGRDLTFKDISGKNGTVVYFICNHCPFVIHINDELVSIARDYQDKGVGFVAISSNDADNYPQDGPELMHENATELGFTFPYLYDENQSVAKAYDAACTPDSYLFDAEDKCFYHGQIDDSRPGNDIPVSGKDFRNAIDTLLAGEPFEDEMMPSIGCNIKWKEA